MLSLLLPFLRLSNIPLLQDKLHSYSSGHYRCYSLLRLKTAEYIGDGIVNNSRANDMVEPGKAYYKKELEATSPLLQILSNEHNIY